MKKLKAISFLILMTILVAALLNGGCSQRECTYIAIDPNGAVTGLLHYKSNHVATDTTADNFKIKTPRGVEVEFNKFKQDNDSLEVVIPAAGILKTVAE